MHDSHRIDLDNFVGTQTCWDSQCVPDAGTSSSVLVVAKESAPLEKENQIIASDHRRVKVAQYKQPRRTEGGEVFIFSEPFSSQVTAWPTPSSKLQQVHGDRRDAEQAT